jgi:hypothetical protein
LRANGDLGLRPIVCCLVGGDLQDDYDSCSGIQSTYFGGTSCPQLGQTCTPIYTTGTPIGVCLPQ